MRKSNKRFLICFHTNVHSTYVLHDMLNDSKQNFKLFLTLTTTNKQFLFI